MMHPVALLDAFTMLCWLSAIVSLLLPRKSDLPQRVRLVLIGLTTSSFAYAACIFLGWANITSNLEQVEDLIGVTLPVWWGFAAYAMAQRVINADLDRNREELRYAQTVAQLISWKLDLASDRLTWTGDTDILFGGALAHLGTRREYHAIIHPEDRSRIEEAWNAAINGAEYECEYRIESQQTTFWVRERACFDRLLGGRQIRGTGAIHDVTARIQAEQERAELEAKLRQSQKLEAIGQLAGGVAHDFNNILTAILGSVDLELERLRSDPDEADARLLDSLALIERGAQRASALTRQLLAFGRCQTTNPTHLDLNALLKNLEMMMRRLISEDIFIEIVTGKHLRPVFADAGQLEQVIVNLAVNAADSMPKGGRLSIETANVELDDDYVAIHADTRYGPHVLLAVSDTGVGMPPAVYERVFEPFFTTKPVGKGTGLGLSTAYGIVKQSGGHITVYSEVDQGTTFKVYLPATEQPTSTPTEDSNTSEAPRRQSTGGETLLLCEDDEAVRKLTVTLIEAAGYTVLSAPCGKDALKAAATHDGEIDLLITDVVMPDMNGRELARLLHQDYPALPTLFVSGYTANVIAHHGVLDAGIEFLEKPFTGNRLLARIREVLDKAQSKLPDGSSSSTR